MRSSLAGPSNSSQKPKSPGVHTSFSNPSGVPAASPVKSPTSSTAKLDTIRVFASDEDAFPLAQFDANTSPSHILHSLKLHNGGLKVKGGDDTFFSGDAKLASNDYVIIGSSGIRVRVTCKGNRMIVPYPFPTHQVQQLMEEVALRFARFNTTPGQELKIAELRTLDGYLLNKYDRIMEVVYDDDNLEAIDFDIWIAEQAKLCKESWLRIVQSDFVDNVSKWCEVGRHAHGKLYLQTGKGKEVGRLELFEVEDLKMFAKEGQQQVLTQKGKKDNYEWFSNVSFVIKGGQVSSVILEVKSLSDARPMIKEIPLTIENNVLQQGETRVVQFSDEDDTVDERPLPPSSKHEDPIVNGPAAPTPLPLESITAFQKLKIAQVEQIYADQAWARDGQFSNSFYVNLSFTNPNDTIVTIVKVKAEYFNGTEWTAANDTAIGHKAGFYNYRWNWNTSNFSVDAHQVEQVAVLCGITIKAPQVDRLRRAHYTLPQPLKIRITFEDDQGSSSAIEVEYYNPPHDLPTKESVEKYNSKKYDFFVTLDDKEAETRHYIAVGKIVENANKEYLEVKISGSGSTYYFYQTEFRRLAFEGVTQGNDVVEIENLKMDKNGVEAHAYALVDLAKRKVWAIKFTMKANGGASFEEYLRITPLKFD